jgi:hypothetical protein
MPGAIPHLLAGLVIFTIGSIYYKKYFTTDNKIGKLALLAFVCIFFSVLPDLFLIIYYSASSIPKMTLEPYHNLLHFILAPIAIGLLIIIKYGNKIKSKPIWIIGLWCILIHIAMDLYAPEEISVWI